ncbi:MAG TPA: sigma-70 family RNA polymerase sigma factor [Pyrinomonadaceae bacterium]|nr:sigma-70 family RNA polymerase sigma factor [Pyrinomonadaceae bacterium]
MKTEPTDIAELQDELEKLHSASFGWALSCCRRDHAEAEEVLQTVYLKILEGKAKFRGESSLKTWLFAVIRKTAIGEYRKKLLRNLVFIGGLEKRDDATPLVDAPGAAFEKSEIQKQFRAALAKLPARQREVLHLAFYEDMSLSEAAVIMGISIGSARQHYERGKKHLREWLSETETENEIVWRRKETPSAV